MGEEGELKLRSAVVSFSDEEINEILKKQDLPVSSINVRSADGKITVRVRKGLSFTFSIVLGADGRHLTATVDAGVIGNPVAGMVLSRISENAAKWGVSLFSRTLVFDPQKALLNADIDGDFRIVKTAVGAGELVFALEGDLPLVQFTSTTRP